MRMASLARCETRGSSRYHEDGLVVSAHGRAAQFSETKRSVPLIRSVRTTRPQ